MQIRARFWHFAGLATLIYTGQAQSTITACPSIELDIISSDAAAWKVCPNTNYLSANVTVLNAVKSRGACVELCDQYYGCKYAAYDKTNWLCELKGNSSSGWTANAAYETIRFMSKPSVGDAITKCPVGAFNITTSDDAQWAACPNTDYQGTTTQAQEGITSEQACAQLCSQQQGCSQAVYDSGNMMCHLKDAAQTSWVYNPQYKSIQLQYRPQAGDPINYCPSAETNVTSSKGRGFAICANTDYAGPATEIVGNTDSAFNCMLQCDSYTNCSRASFDLSSQTCFLKSWDEQWVYAPGSQGVRLVNGSNTYTGNRGKWATAVGLPVIPAGAFIVPEQPKSYRILGFSSWGPFEFSGPTGMTQFADYNWKTGAVSHRNITNTQHDMFCPGMSFLANGTMVVNGGENAEAVSFYNFKTNSWSRAADMKVARGYQSSTILSDGKIFTIGGSFTGGIGGQDVAPKAGEVYDPVKNTWTLLSGCDVKPMLTTYDAEGLWRTDNHAWLFPWKNGYVFQAGPSKTMHWYGTSGTGSVAEAGTRDTANDAMCGVSVMYDAVAGKIFTAAGSQSYTNSPAFKKAHLITIAQPLQPATVEVLPNMTFQRGFANTVVLPNGQVLITGGQSTSLVFTDIQSVYAPELFDPVSKNFTIMAPAAKPRNYHSVSLLLADGTVWAAGGGMCPVGIGESTAFCDMSKDHPDGEIFSPPYLFKADGTPATRPVISSLKSNSDAKGYIVKVGGNLIVTMNTSNAHTFALLRIGSATHSINTDQRRVPLSLVTKSGTQFTATLPKDAGILTPGFYYLFALNAAGVPSEAFTVQVAV